MQRQDILGTMQLLLLEGGTTKTIEMEYTERRKWQRQAQASKQNQKKGHVVSVEKPKGDNKTAPMVCIQ
jgi:hypothetical protein